MNKYNLIDTFFIDQEDYIKFLVELKERTIANDDVTCFATLEKTDKGILYKLSWLKDGKYIGDYIKPFKATKENIKTFNEGCKILAERLEVFIDTNDVNKVPDDPPAFRHLTLFTSGKTQNNNYLLSKIERCKAITKSFIDSYFEKASESAWNLEPKKNWVKLFPAKYKKQYKKTLREDINSIFQQKIPQGKINFATLWKMYGLSDENLEKSKLAKYSLKWFDEKELLMKQWFEILYENIDTINFEILKNNSKEIFSQEIRKLYDSGVRITAFYNIESIIDTIDGRYPNLYNLHIDEQDDVLTKTGEKNEAQLLIEYAKAWNNLDISYLKDILSDDFEYTSQWVFDTIHGKENYIDYLEGKFKTIKETNAYPQAEIGYYKYAYGVKNKPCIVIEQNENKMSILVEISNGKITKANMVGVPDPNTAITFDYFPK